MPDEYQAMPRMKVFNPGARPDRAKNPERRPLTRTTIVDRFRRMASNAGVPIRSGAATLPSQRKIAPRKWGGSFANCFGFVRALYHPSRVSYLPAQ
jgi:hypothetical protein